MSADKMTDAEWLELCTVTTTGITDIKEKCDGE